MHGSVVALKQHFGDAGGETKVTVNLEGRMRIEDIGLHAAVGVLALQ